MFVPCRYSEVGRSPVHPSTSPLTHYVVVRADLPRGLQAAQIVHAAGQSVGQDLPDDTHAVVLTVPDAPRLAELEIRLRAAGVEFRMIVEEDDPWTGQAMAIGLRPRRKEELRRHLSALPLLR